jgi:hypothetical protein
MTINADLQSYTFSIAAGATETRAMRGEMFYVLAATGTVRVTPDNRPGADFEAGQGRRLKAGDSFESLAFYNAEASSITITVQVGSGEFIDNRLTVQDLLGTAIAATAAAPTTAATLIVAANTSRKAVTLKNAGSVTVYLGASGVTTAAGSPLLAGESFSTERTSAALYGITASGTGDVRVLEES